MIANLVLLAQGGKQKVFKVPGSVTVIGRRHNCDLRIPLESVSRRHCELLCGEDRWVVRDLGSRNGTRINGHKVKGEEPIAAGDFIQVGDVTFALQIDGQPQTISPPAAPASALDADDTALENADPFDEALDGLGDSAAPDDPVDFSDLDDDNEKIDLDSL